LGAHTVFFPLLFMSTHMLPHSIVCETLLHQLFINFPHFCFETFSFVLPSPSFPHNFTLCFLIGKTILFDLHLITFYFFWRIHFHFIIYFSICYIKRHLAKIERAIYECMSRLWRIYVWLLESISDSCFLLYMLCVLFLWMDCFHAWLFHICWSRPMLLFYSMSFRTTFYKFNKLILWYHFLFALVDTTKISVYFSFSHGWNKTPTNGGLQCINYVTLFFRQKKKRSSFLKEDLLWIWYQIGNHLFPYNCELFGKYLLII